MLKLKCVDETNARGLKEKAIYYGFPINESAAYISRFPRRTSHTGCFQLSRFLIIEEINFPEIHDDIKEIDNKTDIQLSLF
ncbi:hypothetical protein ACMGD3_24365 [Lysinibacillus sphaericus]|uniref:hypothetical protein n=1 Tax=Lysinibacillus sphaericus TaxID=1421 RepID=UPI003F79855B